MHNLNLQNWEPKELWSLFDQLRQIPRKSGDEEAVSQWILDWAEARGFAFKTDAVGNICIHVPATVGYESAPVVCLQNHKDMVCVQSQGRDFDFATQAIELTLSDDGEWLKADRTTLGADNGIGLVAAMAMAIDPTVKHGPLEILVTCEEETTFKGAFGLDAEALDMKCEYFLNLDGEEFGDIYVGSAGMKALTARIDLTTATSFNKIAYKTVEVSITGFPGGHSGAEIHQNRGNAILTLLESLHQLKVDWGLISIDGGQAKNAIPPFAKAIIAAPNELDLKELFKKLEKTTAYQEEAKERPNLNLTIKQVATERAPIANGQKIELLEALLSVPDGLIKMHPTIPDLVATSSNFGVIKTTDDQIICEFAIRSNFNEDMATVGEAVTALLEPNGFKIEVAKDVTAWEGDPNLPIIELIKDCYKIVTGRKGRALAIHAGLEVGPISGKLREALGRDVQAASFGPDIINPHSPDEAVNIKSVSEFYDQLKLILSRLK